MARAKPTERVLIEGTLQRYYTDRAGVQMAVVLVQGPDGVSPISVQAQYVGKVVE